MIPTDEWSVHAWKACRCKASSLFSLLQGDLCFYPNMCGGGLRFLLLFGVMMLMLPLLPASTAYADLCLPIGSCKNTYTYTIRFLNYDGTVFRTETRTSEICNWQYFDGPNAIPKLPKGYSMSGWTLPGTQERASQLIVKCEFQDSPDTAWKTDYLPFLVKDAAPSINAPDQTLTLSQVKTWKPLDGVTAADAEDGNLTGKIVSETAKPVVMETTPGKYRFSYSVTDSAGNKTTTSRTITVVDDRLKAMPSTGMSDDLPLEVAGLLTVGVVCARRRRG